MLNEALDTNAMIRDIKGSLSIELRDASSGKIVEQQEATNFVSMATARHFKWLQRSNHFKVGISALNAGKDTDYAWPACQDALVLTSSTATPNQSTEWQMFGKLIGYSLKSNSANTDLLLGTPNAAFCDATPTYTKWAFDWSTQAANGTIGSVGWMCRTANTVGTVAGASFTPGAFYSSASIQDVKSTPNNYAKITKASSTKYYLALANSPTIMETDQDFVQTNSFTVGSQFKASTTLTGIAWDSVNNKLWVLGINGSSVPVLVSYNANGTGPTSYSITNRAYKGLTFDGTNLITISAAAPYTIYKINLTGGDVSNFAITTNIISGAPYALSYLSSSNQIYISTLNGAIHAVDLTGQETMIPASVSVWGYNTGVRTNISSSTNSDILMLDTQEFLVPLSGSVCRVLLDGMGTRAKLSAPITKTSLQTLRIIYQMDYT